MDKNNGQKKKVFMGVVAAAIIVVIVVVAAVTVKNKSEDGNGTTIEQTTGIEDVVTFTDEIEADDNEKNKDKDNDKKASKDGEDDTTNFWDNVEIIEQTDSTEVKTDENGETVTEAYPGEGDGWSPIVSLDDLKEDK